MPLPELSDVFMQHNLKQLSQVINYCNPAELSLLRTAILVDTGADIYHNHLNEMLDDELLDKLHEFESAQQALISAIMLNEEDGTSGFVIRGISFTRVFGLLTFIFGAAYVVCITWIPIPEDNIRFADMCSGFILGTVLATIVNFFFGSSSLASTNAKTIYRQASRMPALPTAQEKK